MIGSDGIFDKLKNDKINKTIWDITTFQRAQQQLQNDKNKKPNNIKAVHSISGLVADEIL